MLRRGVGVAGLKQREQQQQTYKQVGAKLEENQMQHLQASLATFRSSLEAFAFKYKEDIAKKPLFRAQFHRMCVSAGVDPLACHKGFWASLLGLGDFYFELSVQVLDVCLATRASNGGLIEMREVLRLLKQRHKHIEQQNVTLDDVAQAVAKLTCLGSGFEVLPVGGPANLGRHILKSVPIEASVDHLALIRYAAEQGQSARAEDESVSDSSASVSSATAAAAAASSAAASASPPKGCVIPRLAERQLGWSSERLERCIHLLLEEGMLWLDMQGGTEGAPEVCYWFPSLVGL